MCPIVQGFEGLRTPTLSATGSRVVEGIPGLLLPHTYKVKGCCPQCKQIPDNKDEIIFIYEMLPPRM